MGEISINLPGMPEIVRALDKHSGWTKRLEVDNYMRKMELSLQVKCNRHIFHAVLRLPPSSMGSSITYPQEYELLFEIK
jgi:hypothetical protein